MEKLNEMRKRERSVSKIRKLTRAMDLMSAAKLRDSRERQNRAHPFITQSALTIAELVQRSPDLIRQMKYFYNFEDDDPYPIDIYLLTGDQGLSGTFNDDIINLAKAFMARYQLQLESEGHHDISFTIFCAGKQGRDRLIDEGYKVVEDFSYSIEEPTYYKSMDLAEWVVDRARDGSARESYFFYSRLDSAASTEELYTKVLPFDASSLLWLSQTRHEREARIKATQRFVESATRAAGLRVNEDEIAPETARPEDSFGKLPFVIEGSEEKVMAYLVGTHVNALVFGMLTETYASEQLQRMTLMESATRNADELLDQLRRERNRSRQGQITLELNEIVSGAESMKE